MCVSCERAEMEAHALHGLLLHLLLSWTNAAFTEVPVDSSVCEGEDVEMPCAFRAVGVGPLALEIQWWYLKEAADLQLSTQPNRAKVVPRDATKISTVRVQGNAISHKLSLSNVRKEDEGVYECRVSDLYSDETQDYKVQATLRVTPRHGMLAEEAVSHIQNRWSLKNSNAAAGGRATPEPEQGKPHVPLSGAGINPEPQTTTSTASAAKSSASPRPGNAGIRQQHGAGSGAMATTEPLLYITLLILHKLLPFLFAH